MAGDHIRHAGCSCGAVRYEIRGDPVRVSVCHCKQCQLRTGSAFGISCYFPKRNVTVVQGSTHMYERSSDAGRWIRNQFCTSCGNTVLWEAEALPEAFGLAAGAFDQTDWVTPERHVWAESAQNWLSFPLDVEVLEKSNLGKEQ